MAVPRKNLLEAFRDAGNKPVQESEPSAGPFARSESPASAKSSPSSQPRARLPVWLPWACGVALAFVFGLALGRKSASFAAPSAGGAALADERTGAAPPPAQQPSSDPARAARPEDPALVTGTSGTGTPGGVAALYDGRNHYTIVVATYGASRQDFAWATHDLLADRGLQAWPVAQRGDNYLVLVGAAPDSKELEATLARVRSLASWDKTPAAYADAYVERIDRIIDR